MEKRGLFQEDIAILLLPLGIEWRLQEVYGAKKVGDLLCHPKPRLLYKGFQISEIKIIQDMLGLQGLRMMNLTRKEKHVLKKWKAP